MADTLIQKLLNQGAPGVDREKLKREAEEATRKYEEELGVQVPEEPGIEEADFIPDQMDQVPTMDLKDPTTGEVVSREKMKMGASPFIGKMAMPAATRYQQAWTRALEETAGKPGAYEALLKKGKDKFIQEIMDAEKEVAKQSRRQLRDVKEKVQSNKQTAETVDYGQKKSQNASIAGEGKTFDLLEPTAKEPKVTTRKK
jgi:hypothetical protein